MESAPSDADVDAQPEFEHELNKGEQSKILTMELGLCSKMLSMDERNFHCWNYRLWVIETLLDELAKRVKINSPETTPEDIWNNYQKKVVEDETKYAFSLINKNFSNYSAWHFRSKLLPKFEIQNGIKYKVYDCDFLLAMVDLIKAHGVTIALGSDMLKAIPYLINSIKGNLSGTNAFGKVQRDQNICASLDILSEVAQGVQG